eukprot:g9986.t1
MRAPLLALAMSGHKHISTDFLASFANVSSQRFDLLVKNMNTWRSCAEHLHRSRSRSPTLVRIFRFFEFLRLLPPPSGVTILSGESFRLRKSRFWTWVDFKLSYANGALPEIDRQLYNRSALSILDSTPSAAIRQTSKVPAQSVNESSTPAQSEDTMLLTPELGREKELAAFSKDVHGWIYQCHSYTKEIFDTSRVGMVTLWLTKRPPVPYRKKCMTISALGVLQCLFGRGHTLPQLHRNALSVVREAKSIRPPGPDEFLHAIDKQFGALLMGASYWPRCPHCREADKAFERIQKIVAEKANSTLRGVDIFSDGGPNHFKISSTIAFFSTLKAKYNLIRLRWFFFASYHGSSLCDGHAAVIHHVLNAVAFNEDKAWHTVDELIAAIKERCSRACPIKLDRVPTALELPLSFEVKTLEGIRSRFFFFEL